MQGKSYYVLFLTLIIAVMPSLVYSCEAASEKSCCKKEITKSDSLRTEEAPDVADRDKDCKGNCGGDCGHKDCHCSGTTPHLAFITDIKCDLFQAPFEKHYFSKKYSPVSSGFLSIWLPPKIS